MGQAEMLQLVPLVGDKVNEELVLPLVVVVRINIDRLAAEAVGYQGGSASRQGSDVILVKEEGNPPAAVRLCVALHIAEKVV
jgi:hypothetical protein